MRVACVLLPYFAVRLERRDRPELRRAPVVVGGAPGERRAVLDCSPAALRRGVRPGMPLRQALALCREAAFVEPRPALYAETFTAILDALERFSPRVQPAEPGCAFLDLDGTDRLWPDEHALARALQGAVRAVCRLVPNVGIADGMFVARAAARAGKREEERGKRNRGLEAGNSCANFGLIPPLVPEDSRVEDSIAEGQEVSPPLPSSLFPLPCVVPQGQTPAFLADLSVEHLPVSGEMQRRLRLFGLRTLGELAALPVGAVQAQFGREGLRARRLAAGMDDDRLTARTHIAAPEERLDFPAPTADRGALERGAELLLRRLVRRPEVGNRLARRLSVRITLEDGRAWERTITFREATADVSTSLFAVRARLEALELPAAAVAMTLTLHDLCGERGRQESLFAARGRRLAQLDEAIQHLRSGLAIAPILCLVEVEPWSRIPERRAALTEYNP